MALQSDSRNYYDVLHVSRDAPLAIICGSYRTLMQQLKNHPDLGGDTATAALINEAYAVLTDRERRAEYDAQLDVMAQLAKGAPQDAPQEPLYQPSTTKTARVMDPCRECVFCETPHEQGKIIDVDANCHTCGSPLCTAKNQRMESDGQRAVARFEKQQHIAFYTHWPQRRGYVGRTLDVSLNGMRFMTQRRLHERQLIKIASPSIEAVGSVTHCSLGRHGLTTQCVAGVSYVTLRFVLSAGGFVSDRV